MVRVDCNLLTLLAWRQFGNQDSEFFCWNRRLLGKKMFAWRKLRITLSDTPILPHQQHPQAHIVIRIWGFPIASPRRFLCMTIQDFDVSEVQGSRLLDSDRCRVCWFSTLFYSAIPFDTGILTATFPHYGTALYYHHLAWQGTHDIDALRVSFASLSMSMIQPADGTFAESLLVSQLSEARFKPGTFSTFFMAIFTQIGNL